MTSPNPSTSVTTPNFISQIRTAIAQITDTSIPAVDIDLTNCDREPIHIPTAIQPHGVLIALDMDNHRIVQVSQNIEEYLGQPPTTLLGQPWTDLLSEAQIEQVENCLMEQFEATNPLRLELAVNGEMRPFAAVVHRSNDCLVLELEPAESSIVDFFDFYSLVKQPISRLQKTTILTELCDTAVQEIKQISGFDRVMVYRFDPDGSGHVIAEACENDAEPFLGLHYPATDIPKQAKYLYTLNPLRLIPDAAYQAVPLLAWEGAAQSEPLDMSLSTLRSVSPLHTEYLCNMGVRASMSISLIRDRQLWGLIACHHNSPRKIPYETRTICEFLGQVISMELASRENAEDSSYKIKIKAVQAELAQALAAGVSLADGLTQSMDSLLALTGATGVAYCEQENVTLFGQTPSPAAVLALQDWLKPQFEQDVIYQTTALSQVYPAATAYADTASGLLALSISHIQQIYVLWFRSEVVQTVNWAGDPNKPADLDENGQIYLSPRQSFELWKQTVHKQSLPWRPCEIEAAVELRSAVIGLVLRRADELAQLNSELERSNVELDSFAYVASHDLKEPLRGIHNYSSFLIEDYGDQLGTDGADKLATLMNLTQRMEDLINSLLYYSRLGRAELSIRSVDLNKVVKSALEVIQMSKSEQVDFRIPRPLPTVSCDRTQFSEIFTNLITNAIKYNDNPEKWVEIGSLPAAEAPNKPQDLSPDALVLYVRDNGIGIRPRHLDNVFRIFKRLHAPGRYGGGTGAGLTIVKKIVERHGGQIWVESSYGSGSTFFFTIENPGP